MSSDTERTPRVVIALDPVDAIDYALEIARDVTYRRGAELLGVFVEDTGLLEHARSRLAREVVLSGRERPLDQAMLERQLRARSAELRARFESAARNLGLRHAFEVARGEIVTELLRRSARAEALIVSLASEIHGSRASRALATAALARAPVATVLFARREWLTGKTIVALGEDPNRMSRALLAAARLALLSGSRLEVLLSGAAARDRDRFVRALLDALGMLDTPPAASLRLTTAELPGISGEVLTEAARRTDARLLVLPNTEAGPPLELLATLLDKLRSALMLVR